MVESNKMEMAHHATANCCTRKEDFYLGDQLNLCSSEKFQMVVLLLVWFTK
jgi:hypothetical protein